jgi:hypothetical protein
MEEQSTFSSDTKENQTLLTSSDSESATENKTPSFSNNIVGQKYSFSEQNSGTLNLTNTIKPGKILISPELIPGQTSQEKIDFLRKKLGELSTLKHLRLENPIGQPMIAAIFGNLIEAEQACNLQITENENTHFKIAPPLNTQEGNSRSIRMWDIPTHFTKQDIADCFPDQTEIDYITLQESGPGKSAIVTFTNMSDYTEISQEWSITEGLYSCRIFPFYRTRETRMERESNSATLTQLPPNSTVADLEEIIKKTKAKTCYIPRDNTNQAKRFAFLTFTSSSDLEEAQKQTFHLNQNPLRWTNRNTRLCPFCSSSEHSPTSCPEKPLRPFQKNHNLNNNFSNNRRSYANITKYGSAQNNNNINQEIHFMMGEMKTQIQDMRKHLQDLETRIELLEQDCTERHLNDEYEEMEEDSIEDTTEHQTSQTIPLENNLDIRSTQAHFNEKLNNMSSTMEQMLKLFNLSQQIPQLQQGSPPSSFNQ